MDFFFARPDRVFYLAHPHMEFVSLSAMVVTLRGVVVGDFPIQIAKMKTQVIQG